VIVRTEQIEVFDAAAEPAFRSRVAAYLRHRHGQTTVRFPDAETTVREMSETMLGAVVDSGLARARSHHLTWESSLNAFVTLMVTVAPNFDEQPTIRAALAEDHRPPDFRMQELGDRVAPQDWEAAAMAYDPKCWQPQSRGS
jgi:hypothetical protein